jgi:hypothetical protein
MLKGYRFDDLKNDVWVFGSKSVNDNDKHTCDIEIELD